MKHRLWAVLLILTITLAACSSNAAPQSPTATPGPAARPTAPGATPGPAAGPAFQTPHQIKSPHFVDSYPSHGQALRQSPEEIVMNFDFDLHPDSLIDVTRDGAPVDVAETVVEPNGLTMRAALGEMTGDGVYVVTYKACWPDGSCHDGQFAFAVDSGMASYIDMTGKEAISIDMAGLAFQPAKVVVSKGTTVTWTNGEGALHFVNSDPHPSHNALPDLNSRSLGENESYHYTFSRVGEWVYHCSAHYPQGMTASVIVVD
ncbi:MAG: copper resistance protein CopC [Chloroflexi bacterium]|nr:copper resistance protein CopC [Chloroflexota bacterium]